ncbi:hypothetical protein A3A55_03975 [Candidatus Roizmanbacteria bacterium RIFCSPLOWO2_01_FULL_40_14]|nr:MAG: hypothetical protein A3A55_03975 [Candidatus Roizmanbacteria bacterium RIFCSPLOWO2_01_FULL_40_14]
MTRKALRVGFDFDGVVAYNPLRVLRRPVMSLKQLIFPSSELTFPIPRQKTFRFLWELAHETSFFPAYGFSELKKLLEDKKIEGYILTGRFSFLEDNLRRWLIKHDAVGLFSGIHVNNEFEQPHHFKEQMLKKLKLDYYVEDNWDIVSYLEARFQKQDVGLGKNKEVNTEIHWIYNLLDRNKEYPFKHPHIKGFIDYLKSSAKL